MRGLVTAITNNLAQNKPKVELENDMDKYAEFSEKPGWMGAHWKGVIQMLRDSESKRADGAPMQLGSNEEIKKRMENNLRRCLEYFTRAEELLVSRGAKTWRELYPDEPASDDPSKYFRVDVFRSWRPRNNLEFYRMTGTYGFEQVPSHLNACYNELYEACCNGDNAKIEELCLPKDGKSDQQLIQIASRFAESYGRW